MNKRSEKCHRRDSFTVIVWLFQEKESFAAVWLSISTNRHLLIIRRHCHCQLIWRHLWRDYIFMRLENFPVRFSDAVESASNGTIKCLSLTFTRHASCFDLCSNAHCAWSTHNAPEPVSLIIHLNIEASFERMSSKNIEKQNDFLGKITFSWPTLYLTRVLFLKGLLSPWFYFNREDHGEEQR